jgi:hypothetical protein
VQNNFSLGGRVFGMLRDAVEVAKDTLSPGPILVALLTRVTPVPPILLTHAVLNESKT